MLCAAHTAAKEWVVAEPIRIGLVGAGRILPAHLRGYQRLRQAGIDSFRITALTSRTRRDAESYVHRGAGPEPRPPVSGQPGDPLSVDGVFVSDFQNDVDVDVYDSLDKMLAADAVDALDISATLHVHHTAALRGLAAGKHCLVQKPLAISVAAGRAMVNAAQQRGLSLGIMENLRYAPSVRVARWLIDQGHLGAIQMIAHWSIGTAEWSPDRVVAETPWRHQKLIAGGGATLDIGVHLLHELRYLAGSHRCHLWGHADLRAHPRGAFDRRAGGVRRRRRLLRDCHLRVGRDRPAHLHLGGSRSADRPADRPGYLRLTRLSAG
jgi:1,5-anhydro-D-fructose reductase (1,5-anhydro-D-mannitol-forming)